MVSANAASSSDVNVRVRSVADEVEVMLGQLLDENAFFNEMYRLSLIHI